MQFYDYNISLSDRILKYNKTNASKDQNYITRVWENDGFMDIKSNLINYFMIFFYDKQMNFIAWQRTISTHMCSLLNKVEPAKHPAFLDLKIHTKSLKWSLFLMV